METYFISCWILLTLLTEVHSETKEVFRGETVLLFANVRADSPDNEVHLYINGVKDNTLIASWKFEKDRFTMVAETYHNIGMDGNTNIWIYNVNEKHIGKYFLYNSSRPAIELIVFGNSQIKSESSPQNIAILMVIVVLAVFVSASISFVLVYTIISGKTNGAYYRRWKKNNLNRKEASEGTRLVSPEKLRSGEGGMNNLLFNSPLEDPDPGLRRRIVSSEKPQYAEEFKKTLRSLKARMDYHDKVIQKLADKVSSENPQYAEELKEPLRSLKARMDDHDKVTQDLAEKEMVGRNPRNRENHFQNSPFTWGTLNEALDNSMHDLYVTDIVRGTLNEALDNSMHDLYVTDNVRPTDEDYSDWLNRNMTF